MWILTAVFAVLSVVLLSGRGSFLIAGYNTADKEEKAKYDEKRLCRVMGAGMAVITAILLLCTLYDFNLPRGLRWIMPIGIFGVVIFLLIAVNTLCRIKAPAAGTKAGKKEALPTKITVGVLIVICIFVSLMLYTGDVKVEFEEDRMGIHTSVIGNRNVPYEDIISVAYEDGMEIGSRTAGIGSFRLQAGSFKNSEFGAYHLYSYTDCDEYIVLDTVSGVIALNGKTPSETRNLYHEVSERTGYFAN